MQNINGKTIIVAEIAAGRQKPYYIKSEGLENGVYIRVSGTTRLADRDVSRELYYECDGRSFDSVIRTDIEITEADIENLCKQLKEVALANSKSELQKASVKDVTKNVLLSWGILKKGDDGKIYPTNAYAYLTGYDKFHSIQCGVFKGTARSIFLDKRDYDGPLWEQVENSLNFVLRNIRLGCRLEGVYRQDIYELPPDSIRELIVNAIMNCSYIQASRIQVAFRVNLYRNQFSINDIKNDTNDTKNDTNDTKNDIQSETDAEKQLLKLISRNPEMTQKAMAEQLSFSTITIKRMLTRLQRNGKVKREGSSRRGKWIVL